MLGFVRFLRQVLAGCDVKFCQVHQHKNSPTRLSKAFLCNVANSGNVSKLLGNGLN